MLKLIKTYIKSNSLLTMFFLLTFMVSCAKSKQKEGHIYESDIGAFITNATIKYNNNTIAINYPKYNCKLVKRNRQELNQKELNIACAELNNFLNRNHIHFPKKTCTDTYTIMNNKISLKNKRNPCYGFSKDLNQVLYTKNKDIYLIQFQSKFGLFQGEF